MNLNKPIKDIESILGYSFKNKKNLINSLIHPSLHKDNNKNLLNHVNEFERLEFLGDRVLGISIASLIFNKFGDIYIFGEYIGGSYPNLKVPNGFTKVQSGINYTNQVEIV